MRKLASILCWMVACFTVGQVVAQQPDGAKPGEPKGEKPCPLTDARIEVTDTTEGVRITISCENPADILELQQQMAQKKKQLDKGVACGCPKVKCEGTVCERPKCACGEHGQPGPDGRVCDCGCGQEKQEARSDASPVPDAKPPEGTPSDVASPASGKGDAAQTQVHGAFSLCGLEGAKMAIENTLSGVIVTVTGPAPDKIQQRFEKFGTKVRHKSEENKPKPDDAMGGDEKGPGKGAGKGGDLDSKCKKECQKGKKGKKKSKCDCGD